MEKTRNFDFTNVLTNAQVGGDPQNHGIHGPQAGQQVRFRILNANGHARNNVFNLHGHFWQEEPYANRSKMIGNNPLSEFKGSPVWVGPSSSGEWCWWCTSSYRRLPVSNRVSIMFDGGIWGIFRVTP